MSSSAAMAGSSGPKVRSDCEVTLELRSSGGLKLDLVSRVKTLYGESILSLVRDLLGHFGIGDAELSINDSGALPFVIMARIEAAVRKLQPAVPEYLPPMSSENLYATTRDRFRFSRLYLPGNSPGLMINAGLHKPDGIILDLEDSVAPERKDEARILVRNALRQINFYGSERMVRINQGSRGRDDLRFLLPHHVNLVVIPKCEDAEYIRDLDALTGEILEKHKLPGPVWFMPIIESAAGVENAYEIAKASDRVAALAIGLEDYTADLGVQRTAGGAESLYARSRLVVAARAAGIQAIDSVYSDVSDMEGLAGAVKESRSLGFDGMGCIHPRQIQVIRTGFAPDNSEIMKARQVVLAYAEAGRRGLGVVALGTKMIDAPVVARARRTIDLAVALGLLPADWMTADL